MPVNAILDEVWKARCSGYGALAALVMSQSLAPLRRFGAITPATHLRWRRRLGILAALLASLHAILQWVTFLKGDLREFARETVWLQFGLIAWAILLLLWLTSYPRIVRWLRMTHWRELHRLAYVATLWACLHVLLAPWSDSRLTVPVCMITILLYLLRLPIGKRIVKR